METLLARVAGVSLVLILTGCGSGGMSQQYVGKNRQGQEILTGNCEAAAVCAEMRPVTVTNNPADEEFWQFEARVKVRSLVGIPYGRMPADYNVIGSRERCEALRATVTDPTEPCKGPFYFRRDSSK